MLRLLLAGAVALAALAVTGSAASAQTGPEKRLSKTTGVNVVCVPARFGYPAPAPLYTLEAGYEFGSLDDVEVQTIWLRSYYCDAIIRDARRRLVLGLSAQAWRLLAHEYAHHVCATAGLDAFCGGTHDQLDRDSAKYVRRLVRAASSPGLKLGKGYARRVHEAVLEIHRASEPTSPLAPPPPPPPPSRMSR